MKRRAGDENYVSTLIAESEKRPRRCKTVQITDDVKDTERYLMWEVDKLEDHVQTPDEFIFSNKLFGTVQLGGDSGRTVKINRIPLGKITVKERTAAPFITVMDNFLTKEMCDKIIEHSKTKEAVQAMDMTVNGVPTIQGNTGKVINWDELAKGEPCFEEFKKLCTPFLRDDIDNHYFKFKKYDPAVTYGDGVALNGHTDISVYTLLVYLNDLPDEYGRTIFHNIPLAVVPKAGRAVWFSSRRLLPADVGKSQDDPSFSHDLKAENLYYGNIVQHFGEVAMHETKYIIQVQS